MVASSIVLRFRDTTPDVNTIDAHRAIVGQTGRVAWGWWKKAFEEADLDLVARRIADAGGCDVSLIDTTAERMFQTRCTEFLLPQDAPRELVPAYYQNNLADMAGVFLIEHIADAPYDSEVAARIGEQTFLWGEDHGDPAFSHVAETVSAEDRDCLLHLSDLHFGADYAFRCQGEDLAIGDERKTLSECLVKDLERLGMMDKVGVVLVTGDFVTRGAWDEATRNALLDEFAELRNALKIGREQIIAVPGNHDIQRFTGAEDTNVTQNTVDKQANYEFEIPFRNFINDLIGRPVKASLNYVRRVRLRDVDVDVCAMSSCAITSTKWTEYGLVGRHGMDALQSLHTRPPERPTFRFGALHHHVLPVANVEALSEKGVSLSLDAAAILSTAQTVGVNVILHGHQHRPKISVYQSLPLDNGVRRDAIHVVANGSATAKQSRIPPGERNTYCLFRLRDDRIKLWMRELRVNGEVGAQIYEGDLTSSPINVA